MNQINMKTTIRFLTLASLGSIFSVVQLAHAACNANITLTRPDSRYEVVTGTTVAGSEVKDKTTGLVWQRCVVGMSWNGTTCTGSATGQTWKDALDAARTATATTATPVTSWRLPNVKEVLSLIDRACTSPPINSTWFPATPSTSAMHTSLTFPVAGYEDKEVLFGFGLGTSAQDYKTNTLSRQTRLVRDSR